MAAEPLHLLEIGKVVRPHGLKGHVVVEVWTNRTERMSPGATFSSAAGDLTISSASALPDTAGSARWLVGFEGLRDRPDAEALRDVVLRAEPIEVDGALWVHELIGSRVVEADGGEIGTVAAVEANPASDLLVLVDGRVIPLTFVTAQREGVLTVNLPPGLLDL